ncbi:MAG: DedA family protein [Spirochaetes bacterium]|nr:DedA family protein [Spirochaetota bacterium]
MTNDIILKLYEFAQYTPLIAFTLLFLAGFNLPVSEDLVIIVSASIAATITPDKTFIILLACFSGAFISDVFVYLIGKYFAVRIVNHKYVRKIIPASKINTIAIFFKKYGSKTLFFGRFIPFGVRNAIFMTCGLVKMDLFHFTIIDLSALTLTTAILFFLGYKFGENYSRILNFVGHFKILVIIVIIIIIIIKLIFYFIRKKNESRKIYLLKE